MRISLRSSFVALGCCFGFALASQTCQNNLTSGISATPEEFAALQFDYLIIGGGTAGVTLASRLSENPQIRVGIIEAGPIHIDDPLIDIPSNIGHAAGNPSYDWNFLTTPQTYLGGRVLAATRGKLLGGSSAMNFLAWTRAPSVEYDGWDSFAPGAGWNWEGVLPFFRKSMTVFTPQADPYSGSGNGSSAFDPEYVGFNGPVRPSLNEFYPDPVPYYYDTLNALGFPDNGDPDNGITTGTENCRSAIDRSTGTRSYAVTTYHCLAAPRANYHVLLNAQATRILFNSTSSGARATGVEFSSSSSLFVAKAKKEVILSGGAYNTPQVLELSGIGNKTLLESLGIDVLIDLPSVGENLQDHYSILAQYQVEPGILTFEELTKNATYAAEQAIVYNETKSGIMAASNSALAFLPVQSYASDSELQALLSLFDATAPSSALQAAQYEVQRQWIENEVPWVELLLFSNSLGSTPQDERFISIGAAGLHPLARGSVHINSTDPLAPPLINPNYLSTEYDVQFMLKTLRVILQIGNSSPISDILVTRTQPGNDTSDAALISFMQSSGGSAQHPMGTAPMAPQNLGGVVDGTLKVYGTTNLRICDASIFPTSLGAHLQSTVYTIAEKLAYEIASGN